MRWQFLIVDSVNGQPITRINAQNGKNALIKFKNKYALIGEYEIVQQEDSKNYGMKNPYGASFVAIEEKPV